MSISRSSEGVRFLANKRTFSYHFGDLMSSSRSNILFLAHILEIGACIIPCVGFYFDLII